nr:zinc finger, CCHC-type [Tanacetum cinerariifolium]
MHFLLTTLKMVYVLATPMPELLKDATVETIRIRAKWENDDYICKGHILNGFQTYFETYDLSLVQLGSHLRIEESLRAQDSDKCKGKEVGGPSVNMTEEGGKNKQHKQNKGKRRSNENNSGSGSNKKPKLECWKCGKTSHFKRDCRSGKKNNVNAGGSGKGSKDQSQDQDGSVLYMGDDHFAPVYDKGSVALEFSFGKTITLFNVLYVPKLRKNLVSGPMLNKCGYKQVYESDKYILSKTCVFVIFGYYNNGMFMLNLNKVPDDSDSVYMSSSTVVNSSLWHARLGHVHYKRMLEMYKDDLIPAIDENPEKCTTCLTLALSTGGRRPKDIIPNSDESQRDDLFDDVPNEIPEPRKGYKWIFKRKMKVNGTVDKFKARLVIQGFRQKEGIDYFDTYALVARITTIRLLLALAAIHDLVIHQMDVKTTFLNGDLDEEVYMKQPEGFIMLGNENKVCKLVKSLYRLKQVPKQWHQKFDEVVLSGGFHLNQSDKCVYSKFDDSGKCVIICLYVDDMLISGTDQNQLDKTKKFLASRFSMKDMGEVDVNLGIKIKPENKRIVITQSYYIEKILKKFNREYCSPVSTPMDPVEKLKPNTKPVDQLEYSRAIGCLMYAMTSTRPSIAYDVGRLSRFTSNPSRQH